MSYKYNPYNGTVTHIDEDQIVSLPIPTNGTAKIVKQYELTDACIEHIANAVIRKLKEMNVTDKNVEKMEVEHED